VTNAFGSRAPPEFTRGASALPRRPSRNLGRDPILLKEREGERQERGGEGIWKGRWNRMGKWIGGKDRNGRVKERIASSLFNFWLRACSWSVEKY